MHTLLTKILASHQKVFAESLDTLPNYIYTASVILNEAIEKEGRIFIFGDGFLPHYMVQLLNLEVITLITQEDDISTLNLSSEDVLFGVSVDGCTEYAVRNLSYGAEQGSKVIGMSGCGGGNMNIIANLNIVIPSHDAMRIEEMFMLVSHILIESIKAPK